uniref:Uncharacterized protein n=1 Tax=Tanacetum cinerariifolium TaxID=118510 RepID=A0A6L2L9B6_TANCI|nr:hypothetical protein [Tanacetum cinerariifolium]
MEKEDSRALKRLSESQEDKADKKQKLDEEVEELRKHLQIVPNDDDDVYTKATPLALKVPVVDKKYPLTRFTLDQMLNNVRLEVEEESEVSLELLRGNSSTQQWEYFFTGSGKITLAVGTILHYQWQNNSSSGNYFALPVAK